MARELIDGDTEVTVLIPRLEYSKFWHRLVHDRTADNLVETLSALPHCNVTIVPYHLDRSGATPQLVEPRRSGGRLKTRKAQDHGRRRARVTGTDLPDDRVPIAELVPRQRAKVAGKVYSMRVQPWSGVAALELTLVDDTGALTVVFFGRRHLAGVHAGVHLFVEGLVGEHHGRMAMLNPGYEILTGPSHAGSS